MRDVFSSVRGNLSYKYAEAFKDGEKRMFLCDVLKEQSLAVDISDSGSVSLTGSFGQLSRIGDIFDSLPDFFFTEKCANFKEELTVSGTKYFIDDDRNVNDSIHMGTSDRVDRDLVVPESEENFVKHKLLDQSKLSETVVNFAKVSEISLTEVEKIGLNKSRGLDTSSQHVHEKDLSRFTCDQCSFSTNRLSHMGRHLKMHEVNSIIFSCPETDCTFKCLRNGDLTRHTIGAHSEKSSMINCDHCNYKTSDEKSFKKHAKYSHRSKESSQKTLYECSNCPYKTLKKLFFERHMKKHGVYFDGILDNKDVSVKSNLKCDSCEYVAKRPEHLNRHVETIHSEERKYLCQVCGIGFKRNDALKQHYITHTFEDEELTEVSETVAHFKCDRCDKICRSKSALKEHLLIHDNKRTYKCDNCQKCFNTANILQKHNKSIHSSPGSFPCTFCDKKFNTPFNLKRHIRTHKSIDSNDNQSTDTGVDDRRHSIHEQDSDSNVLVNQNGIIIIADANSNDQNLPRVIPISFIE